MKSASRSAVWNARLADALVLLERGRRRSASAERRSRRASRRGASDGGSMVRPLAVFSVPEAGFLPSFAGASLLDLDLAAVAVDVDVLVLVAAFLLTPPPLLLRGHEPSLARPHGTPRDDHLRHDVASEVVREVAPVGRAEKHEVGVESRREQPLPVARSRGRRRIDASSPSAPRRATGRETCRRATRRAAGSRRRRSPG